MFHAHLDYFQKPPLGDRLNTKPGDHGTPNAHNRWFILFYHAWGPAWIEIYWNGIWLRARPHMASQYTWGPVTTLHDFGGVLGGPLDTFFWALTNSWSRLLARVWSGPYNHWQEEKEDWSRIAIMYCTLVLVSVQIAQVSGFGRLLCSTSKIHPFTTSTGFFSVWPVANLLPLIWTGQYPIFFSKCRLISSSL